ncbi:MAG: CopG family transcriptional regulator [Treponema sp.]|nr:CopG family transcriptional regulator [Treponema sp.]
MSVQLLDKKSRIKNEVITTARLPLDIRNKLVTLSKHKNMTKSEVIIEALNMLFDKEEHEMDSYTLGLPYFGKYGSGIGDLSTTYKQRFREYLVARQNSY